VAPSSIPFYRSRRVEEANNKSLGGRSLGARGARSDLRVRACFSSREISEQGSVPELKFVNRGAEPVLIVDTRSLRRGADRIVNLTILEIRYFRPAHGELPPPHAPD
jgi:hypothetical protein